MIPVPDPAPDLAALITAVHDAIDTTDREYAQMPLVVRLMVRRGFGKRTGRDVDGWRTMLTAARRGVRDPALPAALEALAAHYDGAPARARRGMGASAADLAVVEQRSRARADAARALRAALTAVAGRS